MVQQMFLGQIFVKKENKYPKHYLKDQNKKKLEIEKNA